MQTPDEQSAPSLACDEQLRAILAAMKDTVIITVDAEGQERFVRADYTLFERYGYPLDATSSEPLREFVDSLCRDGFSDRCREVMAKKSAITFEFAYTFPLGKAWFEACIAPLNNNGALSGGATCAIRDVTGRHNAIEALEELVAIIEETVTVRTSDLQHRENQLSALFNSIPDIVWIKDTGGHYLKVNSKFADLLAIQASDIEQKTDAELFPPAIATIFATNDRLVEKEEHPLQFDEPFRTADGHVLIIESIKSPYRDAQGKITGIVGVARDVTERKMLERDKLRRERLSGVLEMAGAACHEMNQPLQVILGYTELLQVETTNDSSLELIAEIKQQVMKLAAITKKLSQITRYETKNYIGGSIIDIDKSSESHS